MGDAFTVEYPTGSGTRMRLGDVARDLARRLVSIWLPDADRHAAGARARYQKFRTDPEWRDLLWFHEYFHGDTGAGLGRLAPDRLDRPRGTPAVQGRDTRYFE